MSKLVSISNIFSGKVSINSKLIVKGWVRTRRDSKSGLSFLIMYDGSCFSTLQVITYKSLNNYQKEILNLTAGCSIVVTGVLIKSIGKEQPYEVKADKIEVLGWVNNPSSYPITPKKHSLKYLRKFAHLRPRTNLIGAITRVRHNLSYIIHNFMNKNGFLWIPTPLITTLDTEGSGEMFRVSTFDPLYFKTLNEKIDYSKDFFGKETFLTVSGQLTCESYACALSKVYTFGPTFRAEQSNTKRHLAEFWMVEPEIAFATLNQIIDFSKIFLKYIFQSILDRCEEDIHFFNKKIDKNVVNRLNILLCNEPICISYTEAINILRKCSKFSSNKVEWGDNLSSEHERYLTDKYFKNIVIVKDFPKKLKAFYMRINNDEKTVAAMDILVPNIGEIIGGSQREERLEKLDIQLKEKGLSKEDYWWYRDLRRYGTVPHSGFGLGLERLISFITGVNNIKDVVPFPRSPYNANF